MAADKLLTDIILILFLIRVWLNKRGHPYSKEFVKKQFEHILSFPHQLSATPASSLDSGPQDHVTCPFCPTNHSSNFQSNCQCVFPSTYFSQSMFPLYSYFDWLVSWLTVNPCCPFLHGCTCVGVFDWSSQTVIRPTGPQLSPLLSVADFAIIKSNQLYWLTNNGTVKRLKTM